MTSTYEIKQDILSLRGATVKIFGQPTTLPDSVDELTIDIVDILNALAPYEFDMDMLDLDDISDDDAVYARLEEFGYIADECDYRGDNSYNWNAPLSNDIDFRVYQNQFGGQLVALMVHRFGDVRCNYTDSVLYSFNNDYEFLECLREAAKTVYINIDGADYSVDVDPLSDSYAIYDGDDTYICDAYGDMDDIVEKIKQARQEE